jgi:hypothetical protein
VEVLEHIPEIAKGIKMAADDIQFTARFRAVFDLEKMADAVQASADDTVIDVEAETDL